MLREINYDLIPRERTQVLVEKEWISSWLHRSYFSFEITSMGKYIIIYTVFLFLLRKSIYIHYKLLGTSCLIGRHWPASYEWLTTQKEH
jgi:predicted N-acyltransferase